MLVIPLIDCRTRVPLDQLLDTTKARDAAREAGTLWKAVKVVGLSPIIGSNVAVVSVLIVHSTDAMKAVTFVNAVKEMNAAATVLDVDMIGDQRDVGREAYDWAMRHDTLPVGEVTIRWVDTLTVGG